MFDITRSKTEKNTRKDFVALACGLEKCLPKHSLFVIQFNEELFEFHYTGRKILHNVLNSDSFHKIVEHIDSDEVPAFIAYCKNVEKNADPKYGYFYSGELYNRNGSHFGKTDLGESMTCVGFCLNILKGFLFEDYLKFEDWLKRDPKTPEELDWLIWFCDKHHIPLEKIKGNFRRISPLELLASTFYTTLPITKKETDFKSNEVFDYLCKSC
ncbi:MAG: hypothetical protein ACI9EK_002565 [Psychroserpens sp.]|jgi:hypothetical protein